jgi:hypothetical protein
MLSVYKNSVVANASLGQADLRQRELDFYTNNYWIWGSTATVMAGFVFAQLTDKKVPEGTNFYIEQAYLGCTAISLGLDMCIITWTVLCCVYGPGLALRGPDGMKSFHDTVDFLKKQQFEIYSAFNGSVFTYFLSSCCLLWITPSRDVVNLWCSVALVAFLLILIIMQGRLECRVGELVASHDGDGQIKGFSAFEDVADLDHYVAQAVPAEAADQGPLHMHRGMYGNGAEGGGVLW